ncbi:MAG: carbohydrate porin [Verrucomicrobiota bacterium]
MSKHVQTLTLILHLQLFGATLFAQDESLSSVVKSGEDSGIDPFLNYDLSLWGNTSGGITRGVRFNSLLEFGATADTEKLGWWDGGQIYASFLWNEGNLTDIPLTGLEGAFGLDHNQASDTFRVYSVYYQQNFDSDRYTFKIGQLLADDDFMASNYAGLFVNSAFGVLPTIGNLSGFPEFPVAAPGVFASAQVSQEVGLQTGFYTNDAGPDEGSNWGFDWRLGGTAGYAWFSEANYAPTLGGLPASLTAGFFMQIDGVATDQGTGDTVNDEELYSVYFMWDQSLAQDDKGNDEVGAFVLVGYNLDDERYLVNPFYMDAGVNWFGPIAGRENDVLGAAFNVGTYGSDYRAANPTTEDSQWILELTYSAQLSDNAILQPDIQYIIDPEGASADDALAVGFILSVSL